MPSIKQEGTDFRKYICKFCHLPKYKNENYLPVIFSRRVNDEFFAAMVVPYGLTNDFFSKLYYYETPANKWAVVLRETQVTDAQKSENHNIPNTYSQQNMTAFHNGKSIFSYNYHSNVSEPLYGPLFEHLSKNNIDSQIDLSQMLMGCLKIEAFFCKKWHVKNIRDFIGMKLSNER